MTQFEVFERVILESPNVLDFFKKMRVRCVAYPKLVAFATWNIETLEWCLRERSVNGLMVWEATMRQWLSENADRKDTVLHRGMTKWLDDLAMAYNTHAMASMKCVEPSM
jgi:hypothetical protein